LALSGIIDPVTGGDVAGASGGGGVTHSASAMFAVAQSAPAALSRAIKSVATLMSGPWAVSAREASERLLNFPRAPAVSTKRLARAT
jgi:hypothetical protein